ncbi:MAG: SDR family oxidoreductase [Rhodobacteraceae bacterium]|nr:SDR family oxidoreductase [Paracoccaceae bacterium]MCY4196505.1 SDR family oxidoreductase [Paracoccaceae bacterium]
MHEGALVTGGSRRLGKAIAIALARRGLNIVIQYCHAEDDAKQTVAELRTYGVRADALRADFSREGEVESLIAAASELLASPLNLLVNNAAVFSRDHIMDARRSGWDSHIETNLRAPFVLTQKFAQQAPPASISGDELKAHSSIINIVDQRVVRPTSEFATYTISKMGLWALTQMTAVALAPDIRVNAIGPGPVLIAAEQSDEHFAWQRASNPLRRGADVEEVVAAMTMFLDSPSVTGQLICIEGGRNLNWQSAARQHGAP